jgi:hypothetical protein
MEDVMNRRSLVPFLALVLITLATASFAAPAPGRLVASAGLGFGVGGVYGNTQSPLLSVSGEYGVTDAVSVGGLLGHSGSSQHYGYFGDEWTLRWSYTIVAARGSYHFADLINNDKVDLYAGASLGYNHVSLSGDREFITSGSYVMYGVHAGGRYFFNSRVAGFGELGLGLNNLALGVSARF